MSFKAKLFIDGEDKGRNILNAQQTHEQFADVTGNKTGRLNMGRVEVTVESTTNDTLLFESVISPTTP